MIEQIINGIFTGFGSAIGTYFAVKYAVNHIEGFKELIKKKQNGDEKNNG
jgi:shikimate kinase